MARAWQTWTWATLLTLAVSVAPQAAAQTLGDIGVPFESSSASGAKTQRMSSKAAPKKDPAAAQKEIEVGIASLQAGKTDNAVQRFTAALSGSSLPSPLIAKALYHRGVAFRRQGKPVQAISDLTSALWLKNGLDESERADALAMRAGAYRDAGLPDQVDTEPKKLAAPAAGASSSGVIAAPAQTDRDAKQTAAASAEPSEATRVEPASGGGLRSFFGGLFGRESSGSAVQTGTVPASAPPTSNGWVDFGGWVDGTEVRKSDR
jgi:tetratricopeptide (TPR) repeat protein